MKRRRALLLFLTVVLALCAVCGWWLHRERQQYALNRQLINALEHDDTKTALALVNEGADPNTRFASVPAPTLRILFAHLLHHISPVNDDTPTAFQHACGAFWMSTADTVLECTEDLPLLRAMLAHGANVHALTTDRHTALHEAVTMERFNTVELLLQHSAEVNAPDDWGTTPLTMAATHDTTGNIVHLLLAHGANPNIQNRSGATALHLAVSSPASNAEAIIPQLLAHGADPKQKNQDGQTPLMRAQEDNHSDIVRLLKQGAK